MIVRTDHRVATSISVDVPANAANSGNRATKQQAWKYTRPVPDQLVIDCVHLGKSLHVVMHLEPEGALLTRGFHWINEVPYNR